MRQTTLWFRLAGVVCFFLFTALMFFLDAALLFGSLATGALSWVFLTLAYHAAHHQHTVQSKRLLIVAITLGVMAVVGLLLALV